jgi:EmrB/QacA subfamily drug resistance transporter
MSPSDRPPPRLHAADDVPSDPHHDRRWLILVVLCLAQLMIVVDSTIVNVALPSAQRALHFSTANREWIITAYVLAFGSLLPLGGRMSDLWGRKLMFALGAAGFAASSAVAGAAQSFTMLVAARAAQGMFGALLAPAAIAMIAITFTEPTERAKAFGVFGAIGGSAGALGLLLGGVFTSYVSWRWCMFVNVAFGALALFGALQLMTNNANPDKPRLDILGTVLATAGLFGIVFGGAKAETNGWGATITIVSLAGGVALLLSFLISQRRGSYPLMPLHVIADRTRGAGLLSLFLSDISLFSIFLFLTYYFQGVLHYSPVKTGLAFLPLTLSLGLAATLVQTTLQARLPTRAFFAAGLTMGAIGCLLLAHVTVDSAYAGWVLGGLILIGLGFGTSAVIALDISSVGVAPEDTGVAGSLANVAQQIGPAIGIALLSTVAASATTHYTQHHAALHDLAAHATVHGFVVAFRYGAVIFAAAAVICTLLVRNIPRRTSPTASRAGAAALPGLETT